MESIFEDYQKQLKELKKTVDEMAFRAEETAFRAEEKIKYYESLELQNRELLQALENTQKRVKALEKENSELKERILKLQYDPWSSRVTYENVVEQIASIEDKGHRDIARSVVEPLLKKEQARRFRKDINAKIREAEGFEPKVVNVSGNYNDIHENARVQIEK